MADADAGIAFSLCCFDISIGYSHICALTIDGDVYCWGLNDRGQVGDGSTAYRPDPHKVAGIEEAISFDAGIVSTCVVEAKGSVKCWGTEDPGKTGGGFVIESTRPKQILKLDDVVSVTNARNYFCAQRRQGQLLCLGSGAAMPQMIIDPSALESLIKTLRPEFKSFLGSLSIVGGTNRIVAADLSIFNGCAIFEDGRMTCWGARDKATIVTGIGEVKKVEVGSKLNCALLRGGYVRCWGEEVRDHNEIIFPSDQALDVSWWKHSRNSATGRPRSRRVNNAGERVLGCKARVIDLPRAKQQPAAGVVAQAPESYHHRRQIRGSRGNLGRIVT